MNFSKSENYFSIYFKESSYGWNTRPSTAASVIKQSSKWRSRTTYTLEHRNIVLLYISLEFIIPLRLLSQNSVSLIASRTGRIYANANTHITILLSGLCELLFEDLQPTWLVCAAVKSKPGLIVFAELSLFCDLKCFDGGILHGRPPITNRLSFIPLLLNYTLWVGSTHPHTPIEVSIR